MKIFLLFVFFLLIVSIGINFFQARELGKINFQLKMILKGKSITPIRIDTTNREFRLLILQINQMILQINQVDRNYQKKLIENKQLLSSISHDFRTPLTSMLGYVQILQEKNLDLEEQKYLKIIEGRIKSLSTLVEDFYIMNILESDEYPIELDKVSPSVILQNQLMLYHEELSQNFSDVTVNLENKNFSLRTSSSALDRIFSNLIKNAFTHGEGQFEVNESITSEKYEICLSNEIRHPEKLDIEKVFERTYRGDSDRTISSTGLGLSIVKNLAEKIYAEIEVEKIGNRVIFKFSIPNHNEEQEEEK